MSEPRSGEWAIECSGLTRAYGELTAVDAISLTVPRGSVFGFLGPNGAGKTTTIRLLLGLLAPTAGAARVLGCDLPAAGDEVRRRTGAVLEQPGLYDGVRVRTSLAFQAAALGLPPGEASARIAEVSERLGVADRLDERPATLSRGTRQRLAVARALLGRPELLVLDEPTNGLDPEAAASLRQQILELAGGGTTVFLATHLLAEAERMCDTVAVIKQGRIIASGSPAHLRRGLQVHLVRVEGPGVAEHARIGLEPGSWTAQGPDAVRVRVGGLDDVGIVVSALVRGGAVVHRVEPEGQTLEAAFLSLVSDAVEAEPTVSP